MQKGHYGGGGEMEKVQGGEEDQSMLFIYV
jgi:hypothetical protein